MKRERKRRERETEKMEDKPSIGSLLMLLKVRAWQDQSQEPGSLSAAFQHTLAGRWTGRKAASTCILIWDVGIASSCSIHCFTVPLPHVGFEVPLYMLLTLCSQVTKELSWMSIYFFPFFPLLHVFSFSRT